LFTGERVNIDGSRPQTGGFLSRLPMSWRRALARVPPNYDAPTRQAGRVFERVFLSVPFVGYVARARPYFGLEVLEVNKAFFPEQFLNMYLAALLDNPDSVLYEEIKQNQGSGQHGYVIDPLNPLISFFFGGESFRAEELHLYKAVGDAVLERLKSLHQTPASDRYRQPTRDYAEEDCWRCPIFAGRCLFDFMISEGLRRGVHWHLWLMYLEYWTEGIVRNMTALGPEVDLSREWPTPYHFMLYTLFTTQIDWLQRSSRLDQTLKSVLVEGVDLEYGSIAKSAAISMGACVRIVTESPNITPQFKGYLLGVAARGYEQIIEKRRDMLARVYALAIVEGGGNPYQGLDGFRVGLAKGLPFVDRDSLYMSPAADLIKMLRQVEEGRNPGTELRGRGDASIT
jgi:hypothetical protein